jgi:phage major head subunit gpT-like protein
MSIVTSPKTLARGLRASFVKAFDNAESATEVMPFIMETKSTGADEEYGWLGQSPSMNEWVDERKLKSLNSFDYKLKNKDYEATLQVSRNDIEDDRLGNVQIRINDLALKAKTHPRKLFFEALLAADTALCYDGQTFFSASHSEGDSGTQSNILAGTGTTLAQVGADLASATAKMKGFKDDVGEPFDEGEITIGVVCSLAMESVFNDLNDLDTIDNTKNKWRGKIKALVTSGRLTGNSWYFANVKNGLKPFIRQIRKPVEFSSLEGESDNGFMRKIYSYGVDSREVFGYGLWQKMIKVTNS